MDFKQIKELIDLVNESSIGELLVEDKDFKIRIRHQNYHPAAGGGAQYITSSVPAAAPASAAQPAVGSPDVKADKPAEKPEEPEDEHLITVRSPMIGTFYRASGPDKPPYVKVGDHVDKEDVLCIIEAMKLFNEIESEVSGTVVKVLVENEAPVEYDQPLFLIDPNG